MCVTFMILLFSYRESWVMLISWEFRYRQNADEEVLETQGSLNTIKQKVFLHQLQ